MGRSNQSDVGPLVRVLVKSPDEAWVDAEQVARQWLDLGYLAAPDLGRARDEHAGFVEILEAAGAQVGMLPADTGTGIDSLYARDAAVACSEGLILARMGKGARAGEPGALERAAVQWDIPVLGTIRAPGKLEGGDVVWLDSKTLAAGCGYRTNEEGIRQLARLLGDRIERLITVPLPHWKGPEDVFHLMSIISPLDDDLMLVHSPLMPVPFRDHLLSMGCELVEVADEEFDSLGCNVLALAPRRCVVAEGNPVTVERMRRAGVEVTEFSGREICLKGSGGPTCLTRPVERAATGWASE